MDVGTSKGLLVTLCSCTALMADDLCVKYLKIFFPKLWVSGAAEMLNWVFHCYSRLWPHKFTAILATYGLSLPLCSSGTMHSTHLKLCFTCDGVPILINCTFASWRRQFGCTGSGVMILMSTTVSIKPTITMPFICTLSFGLWSFIDVCQHIYFLFSVGILD